MSKDRLDKRLCESGLAETRSKAQGLILAGHVLVDGHVVDKPGMLCPEDATITIKETMPYVSRGGLKLEKALKTFSIPVGERVCLDVGASTGGFTDCLLQHGAGHVHAVDVGYGQLAWSLRQDPRVQVYERRHILKLPADSLDPVPSLAVIDVSFISLKKVLPHVLSCLAPTPEFPHPDIVALVKPQFEYKDYCAIPGFSGVVTRLEDHQAILAGLLQDLQAACPAWALMGLTDSPLRGPKGNREFLVWGRCAVEAPRLDRTELITGLLGAS